MADPNWSDFRVVLALRRAGSVAGAARVLGVDTSTVSRRLAAAEETFGATLIVRGSGDFVFTKEGLAIADAALVVTPYYNKPTQAGLIAHFMAAADCGLPIVIYNIPGRSVVDMTPATMGELAKHEMIIGVKDATGDLSRVPKQRMTCGTDFVQLSGEDATALGFNAHGGIGCISVTANVAPALCAAFQESTLAGDYASALTQLDRLMPLHEAIFTEPGLVGAKYGMSLLGMCSEEVRLPLVGLTDATKDKMRAAMIHAGLLN